MDIVELINDMGVMLAAIPPPAVGWGHGPEKWEDYVMMRRDYESRHPKGSLLNLLPALDDSGLDGVKVPQKGSVSSHMGAYEFFKDLNNNE